MREQERVERAIKQLASYGIAVGPAESAAGFTRGLDAGALQSAAHLLFRTPPPVAHTDPKDLEASGGARLAEAAAAQQGFEQALSGVAETGRGAAEVIGRVDAHAATEVERIVSRFEDQVEQCRIALPQCPPELVKAMGDSAQRAVCEQLERRNRALTDAADALVQDCEAAVGAGDGTSGTGSGTVSPAMTDPQLLEQLREQQVEQPEAPVAPSAEGEEHVADAGAPGAKPAGSEPAAPDTATAEPLPEQPAERSTQEPPAPEPPSAEAGQPPAVELETSGALPQGVELSDAGAWSPDIWLAEGAEAADGAPGGSTEGAVRPAGEASAESGDAGSGGDAQKVMPATTGITLETTYEVGIERSGQW